MNERILCVDDDANVLAGLERTLRRTFPVEAAQGSLLGLEAVAKRGPFAVVVSDMRMPVMDGVQFLSKVREISPDTVRIMLTGMTDQRTAAEAVNEGNIFRFLSKPCPPDALFKAVKAGIEQHRLITAEREILEKTLRGALRVLVDILSLVKPAAYGRAARLRHLVRLLIQELDPPNPWQIEVAAMLSQIGCVTLPEETLEKVLHGEGMTNEESLIYFDHPRMGGELLGSIPRLEVVAEIVAYQEKNFDGSGTPADSRSGDELPLGARILKVALDFEAPVSRGRTPKIVLRDMHTACKCYDPAVLDALERIVADERRLDERVVRIEDLAPGMVINEDLKNAAGLLLIGRGQEVAESMTLRLHNFRRLGIIGESIRVLVPAAKGNSAHADLLTPSSEEARL